MQVDLNLLVALDALLEENSVQGAAERLRLSAPAMSRTLGRIRRATGDEILVRTGRTMTPTARAVELRAGTRELVRRAEELLAPRHELDLTTLQRTFRVRGHDGLLGVLAPPLAHRVVAAGPGIGLTFVAESAGDTADLNRGQVDIEVGASRPASPELAFDEVGADRMVAVFRAGHPLAVGVLTPQRLASAIHVSVSRRGKRHGAVDEALSAHGLSRRVVTVVPTSAAALDIVSRTDAVTVAPERLCALWLEPLSLHARPVPFDLPAVPVVLVWHRRADGEPAHRWLRTQVREILDDVLHDPACRALRDEE